MAAICIEGVIIVLAMFNGTMTERPVIPPKDCEQTKIALLIEGAKNPVCVRKRRCDEV